MCNVHLARQIFVMLLRCSSFEFQFFFFSFRIIFIPVVVFLCCQFNLCQSVKYLCIYSPNALRTITIIIIKTPKACLVMKWTFFPTYFAGTLKSTLCYHEIIWAYTTSNPNSDGGFLLFLCDLYQLMSAYEANVKLVGAAFLPD